MWYRVPGTLFAWYMVVIFPEYVNLGSTYHTCIYSDCSWLTGGDGQHPYRTRILFFIVKYVPGMARSMRVNNAYQPVGSRLFCAWFFNYWDEE